MRWLDAMPRPPLSIEIGWDRISAVRWSRTGAVEKFSFVPLADGMIVPSAVGVNIADPEGVHDAMVRVCESVDAKDEHAALLVPDAVIRIFVQHFDQFPRNHEEAIPLLQWKLKKSLPFDISDTVLSYVRQASREEGVDVVATVARLRVIREYESLIESVGLNAGVVSSSSLAALALLEEDCPTLVARVSDRSLTTAVIRAGAICGYRCTELAVRATELSPEVLFDEIYPLAAYFQDAWHEKIESVRISGVGERYPAFIEPLQKEFKCTVQPLLGASAPANRMAEGGLALVEAGLDGQVGWMLSRE
jgi:hypothetical protein